jgi:hypothetical protein
MPKHDYLAEDLLDAEIGQYEKAGMKFVLPVSPSHRLSALPYARTTTVRAHSTGTAGILGLQ